MRGQMLRVKESDVCTLAHCVCCCLFSDIPVCFAFYERNLKLDECLPSLSLSVSRTGSPSVIQPKHLFPVSHVLVLIWLRILCALLFSASFCDPEFSLPTIPFLFVDVLSRMLCSRLYERRAEGRRLSQPSSCQTQLRESLEQ